MPVESTYNSKGYKQSHLMISRMQVDSQNDTQWVTGLYKNEGIVYIQGEEKALFRYIVKKGETDSRSGIKLHEYNYNNTPELSYIPSNRKDSKKSMDKRTKMIEFYNSLYFPKYESINNIYPSYDLPIEIVNQEKLNTEKSLDQPLQLDKKESSSKEEVVLSENNAAVETEEVQTEDDQKQENEKLRLDFESDDPFMNETCN